MVHLVPEVVEEDTVRQTGSIGFGPRVILVGEQGDIGARDNVGQVE